MREGTASLHLFTLLEPMTGTDPDASTSSEQRVSETTAWPRHLGCLNLEVQLHLLVVDIRVTIIHINRSDLNAFYRLLVLNMDNTEMESIQFKEKQIALLLNLKLSHCYL